jgi:hypothetical protein
MLGKSLVIFVICISFAHTISLATAGDIPPSRVNLSAAAIVDKNVAARGGLQAWRAVQSMSMEGKVGAGGNQRAALPVPVPGRNPSQTILPQRPAQEVQLPFVMELKRPRKMRIELTFNGQTAVQVFDGSNGWKLRPFLNRRVVEPYTADEMQSESIQSDLDGPLVDYASKGTKIELAGTEKVEDRDTYKLKLTLKSGQPIHVWIDAQTFLEAKIEGQPRRLDGMYHPVEVYYRDYRQVKGLQIPYVLETRVLPAAQKSAMLKDPSVPPEKITIDRVLVNPNVEESRFSKPEAGMASKAN